MKKMMFLSKTWYFSVQKVLIYHTVNKSHHNSFILLVFSHVANFRYVANFRFLTLYTLDIMSLKIFFIFRIPAAIIEFCWKWKLSNILSIIKDRTILNKFWSTIALDIICHYFTGEK